MAIMNSCNKHNMIACVEKTERNTDFHDVIDFLTGCSVNYALLVSPDVIQQWFHILDSAKVVMIYGRVFWDTLRIFVLRNLSLFSFSKPLFSPQWKYLVHTLLHCLSSKSSSWDQFGTNIASALVGLATNQKFNFSKLIFDGMLRNLKDSKPFLMYPRFIQLFLNKQLAGITKPQHFLPTVTLPPKVFTFMSKSSPKFSGKLTPLTPPMLEVATAVRAEHSLHTEELDITKSSHHSDDSSAGEKAKSPSPVTSERLAFPNDYTPTDEVQTSGGDEGHLDLYGLTREVIRLKKQNVKQGAQILRLKTKIKILVKKVKPVIAEYRSFVKIKAPLSKKKKLKKAHKKKSSSFKQGRKKVSDGSTGLNDSCVNFGDTQMIVVDDTILRWSMMVNDGTAREVEDKAVLQPFKMSLMRSFNDDTLIAVRLYEVKNPKRRSLLFQQFKAAETANDEEVARKVAAEWEEEEERKRLAGLERLQAELEDYEILFCGDLEQSNSAVIKKKQTSYHSSAKKSDDEVQCKFVAIGQPEVEQARKEMNVSSEDPQRREKVMDFEDNSAQDVEVMEQHSLISRFSIVQSPEGEYIAVQRANAHIRAFNTLNEVLHILDRQDLHHLHRLVIEYYEHIPQTGLGLILHGDLTTMMETTEESDDELWRNQTELGKSNLVDGMSPPGVITG
ncbi:hypothetical protein Tco_0514133 [Tanacetum coccineum]